MGEASLVTPILKGAVASAGFSGLLAAFGYVVHFSQEDLLGVPLSEATSGNFVLEGARFLADLCLFSFASFIPLIAIAIIAGLVFLGVAGIRKWEVNRLLPSGVWAVLFLALTFSELAYNDLPMIYVSGLLFKTPEELQVGGELSVQPSLPAPIDHVTRVLRDSVICSRVPNLANCSLGERQAYRNFLQYWFILNLFATVLLLVLGVRALLRWLQPRVRSANEPPVVTPMWGFLGALLSLALLLNLFGLPFAYAKTIKQNVFPTVVISLESGEDAHLGTEGQKPGYGGAVQIHAGGERQSSIEGATAEVPEPPSSGQLWQILSSGEERFILYNKDEAQIWSIPKEVVRIIRVRNEEDVLETYLLRKAKL